MNRKKITVYCGSRLGNDPIYASFAGRLGEAIGKNGYDLIYGGGSIGLMGIVADAAMASGAVVTGYMPQALIDREMAHLGISRLVPVSSMAERKELLILGGDAFVVLPGGIGTMEELFDTLSVHHLSPHPEGAAPILLANAGHIYDPLKVLWENMVQNGFIPSEERNLIRICDTPEEMIPFWP